MAQRRVIKNRDQLAASTNPIRRKRAELGLSLKELAEKAGLHVNTVIKVERDAKDVQIMTGLAICKVLGMTLDEAFGYLDVEIGLDKQSDKSDSQNNT